MTFYDTIDLIQLMFKYTNTHVVSISAIIVLIHRIVYCYVQDIAIEI